MLASFIPPIEASPGTTRKVEFNILEAEFGDGYSQPTENGLNSAKRSLSLVWDVLTDDQADDITAFFLDRKGVTPFYFTPPRENYPVKWTCRDYTNDTGSDGLRKVTATFVQSFTLDA
jgi:phage-related protein